MSYRLGKVSIPVLRLCPIFLEVMGWMTPFRIIFDSRFRIDNASQCRVSFSLKCGILLERGSAAHILLSSLRILDKHGTVGELCSFSSWMLAQTLSYCNRRVSHIENEG